MRSFLIPYTEIRYSLLYYLLLVLLKALPPVCMKYTAQDESQVANIARGECYIYHETLTKNCILSYKRSGSALSVLHLRMC